MVAPPPPPATSPPAMAYSYAVNATGETTSRSYEDNGNHREATTTQSDWAGRTLSTMFMDNAAATMIYNSGGQMIEFTDPDGVATLFAYNTEGERSVTAIDLNATGQIDYGTDSVSSTETAYALDGSNKPVAVTISKVWQDGDANPVVGTVVSTTTRLPTAFPPPPRPLESETRPPASPPFRVMETGRWQAPPPMELPPSPLI